MRSVLPILLVALILSSCKKEEVIEPSTVPFVPDNPTVYADFTFSKGGTVYTPSNFTTTYGGGMVVRNGSTGAESFRLSISDGLQAGSYPVYEGGPFKFEYSNDGFTSTYSSYEGTANVVAHDTVTNHITGYYDCKLVMQQVAGTVNITNGEFNIYY